MLNVQTAKWTGDSILAQAASVQHSDFCSFLEPFKVQPVVVVFACAGDALFSLLVLLLLHAGVLWCYGFWKGQFQTGLLCSSDFYGLGSSKGAGPIWGICSTRSAANPSDQGWLICSHCTAELTETFGPGKSGIVQHGRSSARMGR